MSCAILRIMHGSNIVLYNPARYENDTRFNYIPSAFDQIYITQFVLKPLSVDKLGPVLFLNTGIHYSTHHRYNKFILNYYKHYF